MWALGVLIFGLVAGKYPFHNMSDKKLETLIKTCDYEFEPQEIWKGITEDCREFIENLLQPILRKRLTPE